jgi:hypothetical protein
MVWRWRPQDASCHAPVAALPSRRYEFPQSNCHEPVAAPAVLWRYLVGSGVDLSLTGAAILCFQIWQKGNSSVPRHGAKFRSENSKFDFNGESADLYGHFFESQAMINRGGEQWKRYRALTLNQLLENQNPDGSWKAPGGGTKVRTLAPDAIANAHQRTCLCVLMLEIYYHYLTTIPQIRIERGG